MPELPEVDAIAGVARKHAPGGTIEKIEVLRGNGKYLNVRKGGSETVRFPPGHGDVNDVFRIGKVVVFELLSGAYIVVHNAMTGYFDWEHEPWTFDYVEGKRQATDSDVRARFWFSDGKILRFHDARLFGSIRLVTELPKTPSELMRTPNGLPGKRVMTVDEFYAGLQESNAPIKVRLMDQEFLGGIGNIYSVEALHAAGIRPETISCVIGPEEAGALHAALRWSVDHCFPQVRYDWLRVYRRASCGTCGKAVSRIKLKGRSTFFCRECQF